MEAKWSPWNRYQMQIKISRTAMIQQNPNINSYLRLQSNAIQWTLAFNSSFQMQMCVYLYEKLFMFSIAEICVLYIFANQTFDNKTPSDCYTFGYFDGNYGIAIAATQNRNTPKKENWDIGIRIRIIFDCIKQFNLVWSEPLTWTKWTNFSLRCLLPIFCIVSSQLEKVHSQLSMEKFLDRLHSEWR